jgi:AraC family L-rhamnose operon regulatory protein RhaS
LLLVDILDALSEQQTQETPNSTSRQRTVESFLREVENNPAVSGELWTINSMAEHCGMGVTAFSKYCRELVNVGPMEFLNHCRLDRAAQQLRETPDVSITEVAMACGFNSSQYFATRFRQRFHVSPSHYVSQFGAVVAEK